jgi:translation elongation factor EF-Tu-like GTPase
MYFFFILFEPPDSKPMIELLTAKNTGLIDVLDGACGAPGDDYNAKLECLQTEFFKKNKNAMKAGDNPPALLCRMKMKKLKKRRRTVTKGNAVRIKNPFFH